MFKFLPAINAAKKCPIDFSKYLDIRKELHTFPEPGFNNVETQKYLISYLEKLGIKPNQITLCKPSGFYFTINGENKCEGKKHFTLGFRSDIDGLPIKDESNVAYTSKNGSGHLCGHDGHMAMILALVEILNKNKAVIPSNFSIRIIFQPAEETAEGAQEMVKCGAIDNVDEIYMFHSWNELPIGLVYLREGSETSNSIKFRIEVEGKGTHGSTPEKGSDPISTLGEIHQGLFKIKSMGIAAKEILVISVGKFSAGEVDNVIPSFGYMEGTIRLYEDKVKISVLEQMKRLCEYIPKAFDCKGKLIIVTDLPAVKNSKDQTNLVRQNIFNILNDSNCITPDYLLCGEDFSFYSIKVPACCIFMGGKDENHAYTNHHPKFDFNDELLPIGLLNFLMICEDRIKVKLTV